MPRATALTEELLDLVGRIYTSAVKPAGMTATLEGLAQCLGATFTQTYTYDRNTGTVLDAQISHHALTDKAHADYTHEWYRHDPRPARQASMPSGSVLLCHQHFDEAYVARSAFYQEYFIPIGLRWAMGAMYHAEDGTSTVVAGLRASDLPHFEDQCAATLRLVLPHFLRAQTLRQQVDRALVAASRAESIVGALGEPAMLVDHCGRILFLNDQATHVLPRVCAAARGSQLSFSDSLAELNWRNALRRLAQTGVPQVAIVASTGAHIDLVPIRHLGFRSDSCETRIALATIRGVRSMPQHMRSLAPRYGFSGAEVEVLQLLAAGLSAKQVAKQRGASINTVRTQIKALLQKTDTRSQRELLVKCLAV
jgi:DNA-binding CsgD family transcriptional regulator